MFGIYNIETIPQEIVCPECGSENIKIVLNPKQTFYTCRCMKCKHKWRKDSTLDPKDFVSFCQF